jgi:hypothetical protein
MVISMIAYSQNKKGGQFCWPPFMEIVESIPRRSGRMPRSDTAAPPIASELE